MGGKGLNPEGLIDMNDRICGILACLALVALGGGACDGDGGGSVTVWSQTFARGDWNAGLSVKQTSDEGYIVVGRTCSYGVESTDV